MAPSSRLGSGARGPVSPFVHTSSRGASLPQAVSLSPCLLGVPQLKRQRAEKPGSSSEGSQSLDLTRQRGLAAGTCRRRLRMPCPLAPGGSGADPPVEMLLRVRISSLWAPLPPGPRPRLLLLSGTPTALQVG